MSEEKYEGTIFDNNKKINYIISNSKVLPSGALQYFCTFFDDHENNLGECAGYAKSDEWEPISIHEIEKLYFKYIKKHEEE